MAKGKNKKKRSPRRLRDEEGEFRWETYFVRGKQKRRKVRMIDGIDADEFVRLNADDIWLAQYGLYDVIEERKVEGGRVEEWLLPDTAKKDRSASEKVDFDDEDDDEVPF